MKKELKKNCMSYLFKKVSALLILVCLCLSTVAGCASEKADDTTLSSQDSGTHSKGMETKEDGSGERKNTKKTDKEAAKPEMNVGLANPYYAPSEDYNTEEYSVIKESGFTSTISNPLSTFAADVDTASYSLMRKKIDEGVLPEPDAVRIEEMLNYFNYDYPQPKKEEPFSVTTEISDCPWNKDTQLMLIGLRAEEVDMSEAKPSNLVFLIDVSGSMDAPDKLPLVKKAFLLLTNQLKKGDKISIVTYASGDKVVLKGADGKDKDIINAAIEDLNAGGSTAGSKGIETAYDIAEKNFIEGGNNRVILATDGDLNVGITSEGELTRLISKKKESGIFLSVLGFGEGNIKDNKMQALADNGNGNYSYIDSIYEARKVLVSELGGTCHVVAKDTKFQVEFNPENIKGYRLIGYENRVMESEDFDNDKKDGGEIGSGHTVTVLYEIVPIDSPMEVGKDLKYGDKKKDSSKSSVSDELLTVNIRYKKPDEDTSSLLEYPIKKDSVNDRMSDNMSFASGVAEFGMLLRRSEYAGSSSYDNVLELIGNIKESDDSKDEFKLLVKKTKSIDTGSDSKKDDNDNR